MESSLSIVLDTHIWLWWVNEDLRSLGMNRKEQIETSAVDLPEQHRDPQDRLIIATAIAYDAYLMSADSKFPNYTELDGKLL